MTKTPNNALVTRCREKARKAGWAQELIDATWPVEPSKQDIQPPKGKGVCES